MNKQLFYYIGCVMYTTFINVYQINDRYKLELTPSTM